MKNEPTIYELATLAAALAKGTPAERVKTAQEIWSHAATALLRGRIEQREQAPRVWGDLEAIMREAMPTIKTSEARQEKWHAFMAARAHDKRSGFYTINGKNIIAGDKISDKAAQAIASLEIEKQQADGLASPDSWIAEYAAWAAIQRKKAFQKRGKAGAAKKHGKASKPA